MLSSTIRLRMKLLFVTATAISVFIVDCRDFSNEPEGRGTDKKVQFFPKGIEGQGEVQKSPDGPDGHNLAENQDSEYDDQQMIEEKKEHLQSTLRMSKCKSRNACVVMGGFCVTNATLCGGRLVPEGCKGTNCQCCVPGTLEARLDQLEETMNNIYSKMSSMLESQCNNKVTTSPIPSITTTSATTTPDTTSPILTTIAAPTTTPPVKTSPILTTTVDTTTTLPNVCSEADGYFKVPNSGNHCYKLFTDSAGTWEASKSKCQSKGLVLAKTDDPVALRKLLVETFRNKWVWLGARGTGGTFEWVQDGATISNSNSAWYPNQPGGKTDTSRCLTIYAYESGINQYPTQPYYNDPCSWTGGYPLCEVAT